MPRVGCRARTSASAPMSRMVLNSIFGWYQSSNQSRLSTSPSGIFSFGSA